MEPPGAPRWLAEDAGPARLVREQGMMRRTWPVILVTVPVTAISSAAIRLPPGRVTACVSSRSPMLRVTR